MRRALFVLIALTWTACRVQTEQKWPDTRNHTYQIIGGYTSSTRLIEADSMIVRGACVEFQNGSGMLGLQTVEVICNAWMSVKVLR